MKNRYGVFFEAVPDDAGLGGGDPAPVAAPSEPAAVPPAAPPPESWAGPSREEWEANQEFQRVLIEALNEPETAGDPAEPPVLDFTNPQSVLDLIEQKSTERAEALIGERFGPYQPVMDKIVQEEGKKMVISELDLLAKGDPDSGVEGIGEFDREMAAKLAQAYFHPSADPRQVLRAAAIETQQYEQRIRQEALQGERTQMQNRIDGAEPASGAGAVTEPAGVPNDGLDKYQRIAADWEQRRRTTGSPVG